MTMPEEEKQEQASENSSQTGPVFWQKPAFFIPVVAFLLLVLTLAVIVVVKNAGRVQIGPAPVPQAPILPDTTMDRVRRQLARGIKRLERRLQEYRGKIETLSFYQDSLYKSCSLGLKQLAIEFAAVESARSYAERKPIFSRARKMYVELRNSVNDFALSVDSAITGRVLDSLDQEFRKLISE
jgi:hypothetical protein